MLQLDFYGTLVAASLVLLLGRKIVEWCAPLRNYSIPEPVVGGLLVAVLFLVARLSAGVEVKFDTGMQAPLMLAFFASIGLNADLASLKLGGRKLMLFVGVVVSMLVMQNIVGLGAASLLGINPLMGLLGGSITMSGGHGTGAAWSAVFSHKYALASATEVAMACATFGLVMGGLIGGPVAGYLVKKVTIPGAEHNSDDSPTPFEQPHAVRLITPQAFIETLALIAVSLLGGTAVESMLKGTAFELPGFVCVLFIGVLLRNGLSGLGLYKVFDRGVSVLGNVCLSLFLAMALMTLRLWELGSLALPMLGILVLQASMMALFAIFVTFRVMGKDYDAVVLAAGNCGFGLGATPTAIANMQAVTERFGPSHIAFLIVPMVGAFFIDIANAILIKLFLLLPIYG
ncbi:MAG: sodium/glutamate symporter [Iodobacter sp.]